MMISKYDRALEDANTAIRLDNDFVKVKLKSCLPLCPITIEQFHILWCLVFITLIECDIVQSHVFTYSVVNNIIIKLVVKHQFF